MNNKRKIQVQQFVENCLGEYSPLEYQIRVNDDSDESHTDFEVAITNNTNNNKAFAILRSHDYEGGIEMLKGEDFYATNELDFVVELFLNQFLTLVEV